MAKAKRTVEQDSEDKVNLLLKLSVAALCIFSLFSKGELLGLITVILTLYSAYTIVRHATNGIYLEKLFFYTIGVYLSIIAVFGFTLQFFGFNLSVVNFFILTLLTSAILWGCTKDRKTSSIKIDNKRLLFIGLPFFIAFFVYLWPSLPSFSSPCTFGFDCTLHMEYMSNIYTLENAVPPIKDWRYYPNGFHINGALLTHALESDVPYYGNFIYPFTAFIAAMMVAILCGIAYDRVKNKLYALFFMVAILATVYPASALVGFGFWANLFGMYYTIIFAWMLSEFIESPKDKKILATLILVAVGSIISYQILTSLTIIIALLLASLTMAKMRFKEKIAISLVFLAAIGIFYCIYTLEGYSRYLGYLSESVSTSEYFAGANLRNMSLNKGGPDMKLNGGWINIKCTGLHAENVFIVPGVNPSLLLSKGLSMEMLNSFIEVGRENVRGPSGSAIYYDIKYFGLLTIFLMAVGLVFSYEKRNYTLIFLEASIIHLFIFSIGLKNGDVNWYYYSKMMYLFIYPVTLFAVIGLEEIFSRMASIKKTAVLFIIALLLMVSYSLSLLEKDKVGILIGERKDLYESGGWWSLLEFNRMIRYWDMSWGLKRESYGLEGWLKIMNISLSRSSKDLEKMPDKKEMVFEAAGGSLLHSLGSQSGQSDWTATPGAGYEYMTYGPYLDLPKGDYVAIYKLKIDGNSESSKLAGSIDVSRDSGSDVIAKKDIYIRDFQSQGSFEDFSLPFSLNSDSKKVEFRVHYPNSTIQFTLDKITLKVK